MGCVYLIAAAPAAVLEKNGREEGSDEANEWDTGDGFSNTRSRFLRVDSSLVQIQWDINKS